MGFSSYDYFLQQIDVHRMQATHHFELIFAAPKKSPTHDMLAHLWQAQSKDTAKTEAATTTQLGTMGFAEPAEISKRIQQFYNSTYYQQLPESNQQQISTLIPMLIEILAQFPPVESTLIRMLQLLERISPHTPYLTMLLEHSYTLQRLAKLVSISQ